MSAQLDPRAQVFEQRAFRTEARRVLHLEAHIKLDGRALGVTAYCAGFDLKPWPLAAKPEDVTCKRCRAALESAP